MLNADEQLFVRRPLDIAWDAAINDSSVMHLLQPLPAPPPKATHERPSPYVKGGPKGKGGAKGRSPSMPLALKHGVPNTKTGKPLCFDCNLHKCTRKVTRGACAKGLHLCCICMNSSACEQPLKRVRQSPAPPSAGLVEVLSSSQSKSEMSARSVSPGPQPPEDQHVEASVVAPNAVGPNPKNSRVSRPSLQVENHPDLTEVHADPGPSEYRSGVKQSATADDGLRKSTTSESVEPANAGLIIELCAGSAMLSAYFAEQGWNVFPVDHSANRFHPLAKVCNLDLAHKSSWQYLSWLLANHRVAYIHVAPPCGTCSRKAFWLKVPSLGRGGLARLACRCIDLNAMARLFYALFVVLLVLSDVTTVMATRRKPKRRPIMSDDGAIVVLPVLRILLLRHQTRATARHCFCYGWLRGGWVGVAPSA